MEPTAILFDASPSGTSGGPEPCSRRSPGTIAWIKAEARPGDVFYDIGANIGLYSLLAGRREADRIKAVVLLDKGWTAAEVAEALLLDEDTVRNYLLKEDFQFFWGYRSPHRAGRFLDAWCTRTMRSRIEPMKRVARIWKLLYIIHLAPYPNRNSSTDPAEEAFGSYTPSCCSAANTASANREAMSSI